MISQDSSDSDWHSEFPYEAKEFRMDSIVMRYVDIHPELSDSYDQHSVVESSAQTSSASELSSSHNWQSNAAESVSSNLRATTGESDAELSRERETLLFVHGNPTWSFYWRKLIGPLSLRHRCVAVDHVGCGRSDKPQQYDYTLATHIGNLTKLIDELDLRNVTLVAHDWGGAIGLGAATSRIDRFSRVVLLNTGAFPPPYIPWRIRACRIPFAGTIAVRAFNLFSRAALRMAVENPRSLDSKARQGLVAPYDSWAHRVAVDRFVKDIPSSPNHRNWKILETIEKDLSKLSNRPVKLIWGMRDWCFRPDCLERFLESFPNADVTRLENAGHYVVEEATQEVLASIETFLDANRASN